MEEFCIQMVPNPAGKHVLPIVEELNKLESKILKDLDPDKLSDLSKSYTPLITIKSVLWMVFIWQ